MSWNSSSSMGAYCMMIDGLTITLLELLDDWDEYGARSPAFFHLKFAFS